MSHLITILPLIGALTLLLSSCNKPVTIQRQNLPLPEDVEIVQNILPGKYTEAFIISEIQGPKTFNPLIIEEQYSTIATINLFSSLVNYDPTTQSFEPALAKSWKLLEDKLTYQFSLRKGIKWSDGHDFTADDVLFTFDAIFDDRYPNRTKSYLIINGTPLEYKKIDDYTFEFKTSKEYAPFINIVGSVQILPKHKLYKSYQDGSFQQQWTIETAMHNPQEIVGTGPYCIKEFLPAERIIYSPNPHYWKADSHGTRLPYINALIYKYVSDVNTQLALFSTGQTDICGLPSIDLPWISKASEKYDFTVYEKGPTPSISFMWFNMKPGTNEKGEHYVTPYKLKWFQDKRFRQAILYAINRPGIIQATLLGHGQLLNSIFSPANKKWCNPNLPIYNYDPQKAKSLLQEMGFKPNDQGLLEDQEGHLLEFDFLATQSATDFSSIQENLKDVGISMKLTYIDFAALVDKTGKTFLYESSAIGLGSILDTGDPSTFKDLILSNGRFHAWDPEQKTPATPWEAEIDKLFNLQDSEMDEAKRIALVYKIQEIFAEELPLLYLYIPDVYSGINNGWQNLKLSPLGISTWNIDELWKESSGSNLNFTHKQ